MKTCTAVLVVILATFAHADPDISITNWFPNYIGTNIGGTFYACFAYDDLSNITTNEMSHTNASSDVRGIMYAIDTRYYLVYEGLASSNQPSYYTISQDSKTVGTTNITVRVTHSKTAHIELDTNDLKSE